MLGECNGIIGTRHANAGCRMPDAAVAAAAVAGWLDGRSQLVNVVLSWHAGDIRALHPAVRWKALVSLVSGIAGGGMVQPGMVRYDMVWYVPVMVDEIDSGGMLCMRFIGDV